MPSHALTQKNAYTPIAPLHITEGLLRCSVRHRSALSTAVAILDTMLIKDQAFFLTLLDTHEAVFKSPDLRSKLTTLLSTLVLSEESLNTHRMHLHAAFDFETPEGLILSRPVSKTVMLALELTTTLFMGQFDRLSYWAGCLPASFDEDATGALVDAGRRFTFEHLGHNAPFIVKASYELQKVLQRYWSIEKPDHSIDRDGLLVRYTTEPAPECVFRHADMVN